jgi:hypothetical protein
MSCRIGSIWALIAWGRGQGGAKALSEMLAVWFVKCRYDPHPWEASDALFKGCPMRCPYTEATARHTARLRASVVGLGNEAGASKVRVLLKKGEGASENDRYPSKSLFLPHLALSHSGITLCHFSRAHHAVFRTCRFPGDGQGARNWRALAAAFRSPRRPFLA